jgi:hypothetical protein
VLLVVSASDVVEAEADVAEDPCETCEVVPACLVVDEAAEVLVSVKGEVEVPGLAFCMLALDRFCM